MARSLTLTKSTIENAEFKHLRGFRIRVEAVGTGGMDSNIFVYQRHLDANPAEAQEPEDVFLTVASFVDLSEYPALEPAAGGVYFRLAYVDLFARSMDEVSFIWDTLQREANNLLTALNQSDVLIVESDVTLGGA